MHGSAKYPSHRSKEEFLGQHGSFTKVTNRLFSQGRFLTPNAKVVYMTLLSYRFEQTHETFPSYEKIGSRSNLSGPTIAKALAELEEFGWICKGRRFGKSTSYIIEWPGGKNDRDGVICPSKAEAEQWRKSRSKGRWRPNAKWKRRADRENEIEDPEDIPF